MNRSRVIRHPSDFSPASRHALAQIMATAKERRAGLLLVHVLSTVIPMAGDRYISPRVYDDMLKVSRARAQRQGDALVAAAKTAGARASR